MGLTAPSTAGDAYRIRIPMESSRFQSGNNTITIRVTVNQNSASTNYTTAQQPATQQVSWEALAVHKSGHERSTTA